MSADNWARCPRCWHRKNKDLMERWAKLNASYGQIPLEEFDETRAELNFETEGLENMKETFREDYEFYGAEDGIVQVSYSGQCTVCSLALKFEESHPIQGIES